MMAHMYTTDVEKEDCWIRVPAKFDWHNETLCQTNKQTNKQEHTLFIRPVQKLAPFGK